MLFGIEYVIAQIFALTLSGMVLCMGLYVAYAVWRRGM